MICFIWQHVHVVDRKALKAGSRETSGASAEHIYSQVSNSSIGLNKHS